MRARTKRIQELLRREGLPGEKRLAAVKVLIQRRLDEIGDLVEYLRSLGAAQKGLAARARSRR